MRGQRSEKLMCEQTLVWNESENTWQADRPVHDFTSNEKNEPSKHKQDVLSFWQVKWHHHHHVHSFQSLKTFQDVKKNDILKNGLCAPLQKLKSHLYLFVGVLLCLNLMTTRCCPKHLSLEYWFAAAPALCLNRAKLYNCALRHNHCILNPERTRDWV